MKNITVIIPIHKLDETYKTLAENAIKSVEPFYEDVKALIIAPSSLRDEVKKIYVGQKLETNFICHDSDPSFCSQVNRGIEACTTEWFSILEVDDEYKPIWIKSMLEHVKEHPDVDVFLSIIKDINVNGDFLTYTNESCWAYGFTAKIGELDNEVLLDFQNFQTSGGLYRTKVIKDNGMFKENIKLTFPYEFLLRLTHNGVKIMSIPRIGYQHVNFREDSLFWNYKNNDDMKLSESEVKFWLETAKKEFFFKNNRDINYVGA
jgi:hypothetical protein